MTVFRRRPRLLRRPAVLAAAALLLAAGCGGDDRPDAYGSFEATEVTVSAEAAGRLLEFRVTEGETLRAGQRVGLVDTTGTALQLRELRARRRAAESRRVRAGREIEALRAELEGAREELARDRRLAADSAATARQVNLRRREVRVLERRVQAARAERSAAASEVASIEARVEQVRERLRDSRVRNPVEGVVLVSYADRGEHVAPGQPLYDVARLDTLTLHAYVTGAQLTRVRPGQRVRVRYDRGENGLAERPGRVARVASEAEFTPTPLVTREERVSFVYEVEVEVPNGDGALKVGMPGELLLPEREEP